jgi:hypothetical protein
MGLEKFINLKMYFTKKLDSICLGVEVFQKLYHPKYRLYYPENGPVKTRNLYLNQIINNVSTEIS